MEAPVILGESQPDGGGSGVRRLVCELPFASPAWRQGCVDDSRDGEHESCRILNHASFSLVRSSNTGTARVLSCGGSDHSIPSGRCFLCSIEEGRVETSALPSMQLERANFSLGIGEKLFLSALLPSEHEARTYTLESRSMCKTAGNPSTSDGSAFASTLAVAAGGRTRTERATATAEVLDFGTERWVDIPALSVARFDHRMIIHEFAGELYIGGGFDCNGSPAGAAERLDVRTGSWVNLPPLPRPDGFAGHPIGLTRDGDILFWVSGHHSSQRMYFRSVHCFDRRASTWRYVLEIPAGVDELAASSDVLAAICRKGEPEVLLANVQPLLESSQSLAGMEGWTVVKSPVPLGGDGATIGVHGRRVVLLNAGGEAAELVYACDCECNWTSLPGCPLQTLYSPMLWK